MKLMKIDTQDILFVGGAVLVVAGVAVRSIASGLITGGVFLLLAPLLNLVQGFIRGLKQ